MTDDLVKRADEVLKDVTPGPWRIGIDSEAYVDGDCDTWIAVGSDDYRAVALVIDERFQKDVNIGLTARFIAAARELVPAMRDRIEELEAQHANDCEEIAKWREIFSGRTISENFEVVWRERLKRSEAKLAKAVEALAELATDEHPHGWIAIAALAELKGQDDDR